jgi:hypothetical protein
MQLAYAKGARDIWIVNVGDLKPLVQPAIAMRVPNLLRKSQSIISSI